MTAVEFEALRPFLKHLKDDRVEAARLALVEIDSNTLDGLAAQFVVTRQAIERSVGAVWKVYESYQDSLKIRFGSLDDVALMAIPTALVPVVDSMVKASQDSQKAPKKRKT